MENRQVFKNDLYSTFPSLARMRDGRIIILFRQADNSLKRYGAVTHVDPSSRIVSMISADEGASWGPATIVYDDEMGEQDPCVTCLSDGTLICTFFRWRVVPIAEKASLGAAYAYCGRDIFGIWSAVHVGTSCMRSTDDGRSWEGPAHIAPTGFEAPMALRGNIVELPGGRLLAPLYGGKKFGELSRCLVMGSQDRGLNWMPIGEVPGDPEHHYLEPFLYRAPSGRLDMFMRTQTDFRKFPFDETYRNLHVASSRDDGATWTDPKPTDLFCPNPAHILPLPGGKVLLSYGQRRAPKGIQYAVSDAENPVFSDRTARYARHATDGDLGYTSALVLADGRILIVYYVTDEDSGTSIGATVLGAEDV
jgi:hypothetical protein